MQPFRLPRGGQIDRGRILRFSFDGQDVSSSVLLSDLHATNPPREYDHALASYVTALRSRQTLTSAASVVTSAL